MKRIWKFSILVGIVVISVIGGKYLYDFGRPVGYKLTATTVSGKVIQLPNEWVHMAWTPQYLIASSFHQFINASIIVISNAFVFLAQLGNVFYAVSIIGGAVALLIRRSRNRRDTFSMLNGGPYKAL